MMIIRFQTWEGGRVWFRYRVREWKRRGGRKWGGETLLWGRVDELGFSILEVHCQWLCTTFGNVRLELTGEAGAG